jgi:hypothetical protein
VSYTDVEITKTDTVIVYVSLVAPPAPPPIVNPIVYRALCVGVANYENFSDLNGPPYDVDRMIDVFNHCKFGTDEVNFSSIVSLKDLSATKAAIINGIASTFSGADENDISYFYFSGHGAEYLSIYYLCPTNILLTSYDNDISVNELETALSAIQGTKVVILDSCFSGGFIGKRKEEKIISKENLISFNDEIINVFSQAQTKGLLTTNQYKVLTACHSSQSCVEWLPHWIDNNPYGYFTAALCSGCGYDDGNLYADINNDTKVSLNEAFEYIEFLVPLLEMVDPWDNKQDIQVYPSGSNFTIVEY